MIGGKFLKESKTWEKEFTKDYDELAATTEYNKDKLISIILSKKTLSEGHVVRLKFVEKIKEFFGDEIDVFGVGIQEVSDKWDGIFRYKYHLAIENCSISDYWTEKLSDAYLAGAYPFYYGCNNIEKYFPHDCFTRINIKDVSYSVDVINKTIAQHKYEKSISNLQYAKELVLNKYNIFSVLSELCSKNKTLSEIKVVSVSPERAFSNKLLYYYKNLFAK